METRVTIERVPQTPPCPTLPAPLPASALSAPLSCLTSTPAPACPTVPPSPTPTSAVACLAHLPPSTYSALFCSVAPSPFCPLPTPLHLHCFWIASAANCIFIIRLARPLNAWLHRTVGQLTWLTSVSPIKMCLGFWRDLQPWTATTSVFLKCHASFRCALPRLMSRRRLKQIIYVRRLQLFALNCVLSAQPAMPTQSCTRLRCRLRLRLCLNAPLDPRPLIDIAVRRAENYLHW